MKRLTETKFPPLAKNAEVDIFVGQIQVKHTPVAIIESEAYEYIDESIRDQQLEQLRSTARKLGANTVDNIHLLTKRVQRYVADERTPFDSWRQGQKVLHFLRGTALILDESIPDSN